MMEELLRQMKPITLAEMSGVKLMNRTDTKFVTTMPQLLRLLKLRMQKPEILRPVHTATPFLSNLPKSGTPSEPARDIPGT